MKTIRTFAALVVLALVVPAFAALAADKPAEVTLSGEVKCASCLMKKADAKGCQDVLVVADKGGKPAEYYLTKNSVAEKFGMSCSAPKKAVATGTVSEKDGKKWLTVTKIEGVKG
jgi:hypothetical protein